jgi:Xaa-Pro dipeptidase
VQESYFQYLFGVAEDSFYGAIELRTGDAFLFMPRLPDNFAVWYGTLPTPASVRAKYGVQVGPSGVGGVVKDCKLPWLLVGYIA